MNNYYILFRTELIEAIKDFKIIWLSIVFIILGMTQPLLNKYMDVILKNVGGADGITLDPNRPIPSSSEIFISTISGQFNQIGLIILIISFMGMIATDRNNGMQDFILTRPVTVPSYILSKMTSHWLISMFCIMVGALTSYYYTIYFFGALSFLGFLGFLLYYSIWILFVISLTILLSSFIKNPIIVAVFTIILSIVCVLLKGLNHSIFLLSPGSVLNLAESQLMTVSNANHLSILSCLLFISINLVISNKKLKHS
ncbi:membrane protein [Exiguobacterium sp. BMC-KP]|uniref:ABC transporter permease n=1 Tax=Exiguobacterium sp. BMC-KP TaxID=1684312 RepID=UPI0006AA1372|nr:ABC transporter permease subunit [Exiguobacterium sp. BMC-KP]KOP31423.1 membrane protein [Exiguobacterium sp. BMC-KP]